MKTVSEIVLEWIKPCKYFLMQSKDGEIAIQEISETKQPMRFLSCMGVLMKFPFRNKEKPQRYRITIEHLVDA